MGGGGGGGGGGGSMEDVCVVDMYFLPCPYLVQVKLSEYVLQDVQNGCIDETKLGTLLGLLKASFQMCRQGTYAVPHQRTHTHRYVCRFLTNVRTHTQAHIYFSIPV